MNELLFGFVLIDIHMYDLCFLQLHGPFHRYKACV